MKGAMNPEGLDQLPQGLLLWRSILQWYGGIGIIVVAMAFLPELRVGLGQLAQLGVRENSAQLLRELPQLGWIGLRRLARSESRRPGRRPVGRWS